MIKIAVYILGICLPVVALAEAGSLGFGVSEASASERGIGVSPAKIEIGGNAEWPYTVPMTVTNLSSETENFEVTFDKDAGVIASVSPGRFLLKSGERGLMLVTFEEPRHSADGLVKIVSTKTSPEGFTTGTGIEVPFHIAGTSFSSEQLETERFGDMSVFSAAAGEYLALDSWHERMWGGIVILMSIVFLLFLSMRVSKYLYEFSIG